MLHKTRGIVLHTVKYSETSLIAKIYTREFGLQSYLLKGIRRPKSRTRAALFQPLTLLDLVVYRKEKSGLQSIRETRMAVPYLSISTDIRKSSIALFLAELVYKSIREEEGNPALFDFLWQALLLLDETMGPVSSFHLVFALKLCRYLGFQPQANRSEYNRFFNMREGSFLPLFTSPDECLDEEQSTWFYRVIKTDLETPDQPTIPSTIRNVLLDKLLVYYRHHLPGIWEIRSHEVLREVLSS